MSLSLLLLGLALLFLVLAVVGKIPLWPSVLVLVLYNLLQVGAVTR